MKYFFCVLSVVLLSVSAHAQTISLFDVDNSAFPAMKAKFYAFDASGQQVRPSEQELTLQEDGVVQQLLSVKCPSSAPPRAISPVLVIDVSGSMGGERMNLAQTAARAWVEGLPLGRSECAITSFDHANYLNQDFTTDRAKLLAAIEGLGALGGTDYDQALLLPLAGGLQISKQAQYQKVLIILTDGQPNQEPQTLQILAEAQRQNCIVYAVTLDMPCPQSLKDISTQTGGNWFENVTTEEEARDVYMQILLEAQSSNPCEITWQSKDRCKASLRLVELQYVNHTDKIDYIAPLNAVGLLQFSPSSLMLRPKSIGVPLDTTITLTAVNSDFVVHNITCSQPDFSITPTAFTLKSGQTQILTIRYTPLDSSHTWAEFVIQTDLCAGRYYAKGGFPGKSPRQSSLKLVLPNGGETFVAGSDTIIAWSGIPETDTVALQYTIDNGTIWSDVSSDASGEKYSWRVPKTPGSQCLVRVRQMGNADTVNPRLLHTLVGPGKSEIFHVNWSPDGSRVATSHSDFDNIDVGVAIWDAQTGAILHFLRGGTGGIEFGFWSPDGRRLATTGVDKYLSIWDTQTGELLHRIAGSADTVWHMAWSHNGSQIAVGGANGTISIWDTDKGALLRELIGHKSSIRVVNWSHDDSRLASSAEGNSDNAKIWDAQTGELLHNLEGHTRQVNPIEWSPDDSYIVTGSYDDMVIIWDAQSGKELHTLTGNSNNTPPIVQWSPDGSGLMTRQSVGTRVWNTADWSLRYTLDNPAFRWSPDGTRLIVQTDQTVEIIHALTGNLLQSFPGAYFWFAWSPAGTDVAASALSFKNTDIWYVGSPPGSIQDDVSDAVFSIVMPSPAGSDIDMLQAVVGFAKDSVVQAFVHNTGIWPYRVDSIAIAGGDASQFSLVSGLPPFTVPAGGASAVEFRFQPTSVGVKTADLLVFTQTDTLRQTIRGEGVRPTLKVVSDIINFGAVTVDEWKDTLRAVTVTNIGIAPLVITGTRHAGPNDKDFTTLAGGGSFTLQPGDTARLDLRFTATGAGRTSGRLVFEYNEVGSPAVVQLFGEGLGIPGSATLQVGNAEAEPGGIVHIPIALVKSENLVKTGATGFTTRLRFNATLLEPIGSTPPGVIEGNDRIIDLELPLPDGHNVLTTLQFRAALGNGSTTPLALEETESIGGTVAITVENGEFRLLNICLEGGARLINPNGGIALGSFYPNPAQGGTAEVEIETTEIGRTTLVLMDIYGRTVKTLIDGDIQPGRRAVQIDLGDVATGVYLLALRTPTEQRTVQVVVR